MAEDSFETNLADVTNQLVNVTIGDVIDKGDTNRDNVLLLIKEQRNKKKSCGYDILKTECFKRFDMDEEAFKAAISNLIDIGCIKQLTRLGKTTFSLLQSKVPTPVLHTSNEDMFSDFLDFKIYVTESLCALNQRIDKSDSTLEMKDVVINLLKQELKTTQENLKIALQENSKLVESISYVKEKARKSQQIDSDYNNDFINDIPLNESLSNSMSSHGESEVTKESEKSDYYTINNQLTRFRQKMHTEYTASNKNKSQEKRSESKNNKKSEVQVVKPAVENVAEKSNRDQVIVCGDSLLNNIEGKGLSSKCLKANVKNFPGATSEDMIDFVKPLLKKKPKYLMLHIGTNDITSGCHTRNNLEAIRNLINECSPSTELIISEVLIRDDKANIGAKVKDLNVMIESFCEQFNLHRITHKNVTRNMLSKKKLHLNGAGTSRFAQNLKKFISEI